MKLAQLITKLQLLQKELAKENPKSPDVLLSTDEEGNAFGDIDAQMSFGYDKDSNSLIIYPMNTEYQ